MHAYSETQQCSGAAVVALSEEVEEMVGSFQMIIKTK